MEKYYFLLMTVLIILGFSSCFEQKRTDSATEKKGWTLLWEDNFDNSFNHRFWAKIPREDFHMNRYMSHDPALYGIKNGNLVLMGINNGQVSDSIPFLTAGIISEGLKKNSPGRIEVRAKMNPVSGTTPFISLIPRGRDKNITINLMERYGVDDFIYQSVTSDYTSVKGLSDNPPSILLAGVNPNNYNTYSIEKYIDSIVFYVNDTRTRKYPRILTDVQGQFPFNDQDFELFIGIRLDDNVETSELPVNMFIDWVKCYIPRNS